MSATDYKFEGWLGHDESSADGKMQWGEFEPKAWEENDIDIEITHSGVCGSDLHTLRSGWGPSKYPVCVGHEIVGKVVRVGSKAEGNLKIGDRVGVGAQSDSCLGRNGDCESCSIGEENYCTSFKGTYNSIHFNGDKTMGGYAKYHRCPSHFVVKIPDGVDSQDAAPMLCGGVTVFSPLQHWGAGPGKTVGIIGVGGLGHFGVIFAKALGADKVVGISRRENKREEVMKMGADNYIATADEEDWASKHARSLDIIISTVSSSAIPIDDYLGLLKKDGVYVQVGLPEDGKLGIMPRVMIGRRAKFTGSLVGSPKEIAQMLELAAEKKLKPWVQARPMTEANQTLIDFEDGKARYRYVLVN